MYIYHLNKKVEGWVDLINTKNPPSIKKEDSTQF